MNPEQHHYFELKAPSGAEDMLREWRSKPESEFGPQPFAELVERARANRELVVATRNIYDEKETRGFKAYWINGWNCICPVTRCLPVCDIRGPTYYFPEGTSVDDIKKAMWHEKQKSFCCCELWPVRYCV